MKALLVDDSRTMRMILGRMLESIGVEVIGAGDGEEALAELRAGSSPEVMLVDWNMPRMSGIEFIEAVRHPPYSSSAKIIMVTTETEAHRVVVALEKGADEYLMKPFTKEAIVEKLQLLGFEI